MALLASVLQGIFPLGNLSFVNIASVFNIMTRIKVTSCDGHHVKMKAQLNPRTQIEYIAATSP